MTSMLVGDHTGARCDVHVDGSLLRFAYYMANLKKR